MRTVLRDYRHAAKVFGTNSKNLGIASDYKNYRLSPKYGFLFYVEFNFNPDITNVTNTAAQELGMIVKSVTLPKYSIDTKIHNAYNRKNIIQNKINYDAVSITFHDDQADNVRNFWYDYYSFYYRDSDFAESTYQIPTKYQERPTFDWGYSPRPSSTYVTPYAPLIGSIHQEYQYIESIRIYSLYQNNFSEYELVNPIITSFKHGDHANGENTNLLEHQMTVSYETVKYQTGWVTDNTVGGFITLNYDTSPSPNTYPGNNLPAAQSSSDTVTDLASYNLGVTGQVVPQPLPGLINTILSFSTGASAATTIAATATTNAGGFTLPSLGSITSGISNSSILKNQLAAASLSLASTATSTLAGGVLQGISEGLGPQGTQVVSLAAAAIVNPTGLLATVQNMALSFAIGAVNQAIGSLASTIGAKLAEGISWGLGKLDTSLSFGDWGPNTGKLSTDIAAIGNSILNWSSQLFAPNINSLPGTIGGGSDIDLANAGGGNSNWYQQDN